MQKTTFLQNKLWIVTGSVQTGKTSRLKSFIAGKQAAGFLTPDKDGRRILLDIRTGTEYAFQTEACEVEKVLHVGRFCFLESAFDIGSHIIMESMGEESDYFIIDEFGKLELEDRGFGLAINALMTWLPSSTTATIYIMVVRDYLLDSFMAKYGLADAVKT